MNRVVIAIVVLAGIAGCLSDPVITRTSTEVTAQPGGHGIVNVSVSGSVSQPYLCYTANGDGAFDVLVYDNSTEYRQYRRGETSNPVAALSSIRANKTGIEPDVELGEQVETRTYHIVIDNSDYDAIEPLVSGSPSPAGNESVTVDVTVTVRDESC